MTMALILLGRFGMEPLLTLAAVGRMKLWLSFTPVRGGTSLLFVAGNVLSPPTDRRPAADCWPTPLLLPLRDAIDRPFVTFDVSGTTADALRTLLAAGPTLLLPLLLLLLAGILLTVARAATPVRLWSAMFLGGSGVPPVGLFLRSLVSARIAEV